MCPKMIVLPDVVRAYFANLPGIVDPMFHVKQFGDQAIREFTRPIAQAVSRKSGDVLEAFRNHMNSVNEMPATRASQSEQLLFVSGGLTLKREMNIGIG